MHVTYNPPLPPITLDGIEQKDLADVFKKHVVDRFDEVESVTITRHKDPDDPRNRHERRRDAALDRRGRR